MIKESAMAALLGIKELYVSVEGKPILKGVSLTVNAGEVHAIMGPNGSGKSTLSFCLMGHPKYQVTGGQMLYKGRDIAELAPNERAAAGVFLAFQYPTAIPGVTIANFLRASLRGVRARPDAGEGRAGGQDVSVKEFRQTAKTQLTALG